MVRLIDMNKASQPRVSPTVLSIALMTFSIFWFVSAHVFYVSNKDSKDGVSNAPLWTYLFLLIVPASTFLIWPVLLRARRGEKQRLGLIDYCGLGAGLAPFVFLGLLILISFAKSFGL